MTASSARRVLLTGALLLAGSTTPSFGQTPYQAVTYPLHLVALSVVADTVLGLQILVEPGAGTKQARDKPMLVWLRFDPDSVLEWVNGAALALRAPARTDAEKGIQWSRTLASIVGKGGLALGRSRKQERLEREHWLAIGNSAIGWQAEMTGAEADSLLRLILALGSVARLDTTSAMPRDSSRVDTPATLDQQPPLKSISGVAGRVAVQFIVGVDGRVEPGSFSALVASDPRLVDLARAALGQATFHPAMSGGHPVRQLVQQVFRWNPWRG